MSVSLSLHSHWYELKAIGCHDKFVIPFAQPKVVLSSCVADIKEQLPSIPLFYRQMLAAPGFINIPTILTVFSSLRKGAFMQYCE